MAKTDAQQNEKKAVIFLKCDPSLKADLKKALIPAGFRDQTDLVTTLVRDFVAGRFNYRAGYLQRQA